MELRSLLASKDNIRYIQQKGTIHCQEVFLSCWLYFQDHRLGLMLKSLHRILSHLSQRKEQHPAFMDSSNIGVLSLSTSSVSFSILHMAINPDQVLLLIDGEIWDCNFCFQV